jgi:uroporphyrinogen-III synthase
MSGAPQSSSSGPQLWLIKAESAGRTEAYQEEAEAVGFAVQYFPPLAERYETAELEELLSREGGKWDGVIITSKRGAEGWIRAVKALEARGGVESGELVIDLLTAGANG